jgi:hypothetical protein
MSPELRSRLSPVDYRSLEFLTDIVANSEKVEVLDRGCLLFRRGQAEIVLDVLASLSHRLIDNGRELFVTVGVKGVGVHEYLRNVSILGEDRTIPVGDYCGAFVHVGDLEFPERVVPQHLIYRIEKAIEFSKLRRIRKLINSMRRRNGW